MFQTLFIHSNAIWNIFKSFLTFYQFLKGLQIKKNNGIHIPFNKNGKASGEAFVHFETVDDCNQALQRNMDKLGHRFVAVILWIKLSYTCTMVIHRNKRYNSCTVLYVWNATSWPQILVYFLTQNYAIVYLFTKQFLSNTFHLFRYIEIFRSTEQQLMSSLQQTMGRNNIGGRNSNNGNFQSNGNNRMHPYERNNGNNFGRGNNMRGRQQNMRNDFRKGTMGFVYTLFVDKILEFVYTFNELWIPCLNRPRRHVYTEFSISQQP